MSFANVLSGFAAAAVVAAGAYCAAQRGEGLLRPPGAKDEAEFLSHCIKCGKCIEACPYRCIKVADFATGASAGTPVVNPRSVACHMCEDVPCSKVCPTDALREVEDRTQIHMGVAVIDEENCIAYQGLRCEVCYRVCPLIDTAISIDYRMREGDSIHSVFAPVISEENCTGCGLCVERCVIDEPSVPIRIEPFKK